jgi:chorismate-pyruvate lyase
VAEAGAPVPGAPAAASFAERLTELQFTLQHEKPEALRDVAIEELDPFLRALLFTDGTVTRSLEAHTLSPVTVRPLEQVTVAAPADAARCLEVAAGVECVRRRVSMQIAGAPVGIWAESFLLIDRLPGHFVERMGASTTGIGGSLQQLKLESWRELLHFGLSSPPDWAGLATPSPLALTRLYRICTVGRPALLISETFAVEPADDRYRLIGASEPRG